MLGCEEKRERERGKGKRDERERGSTINLTGRHFDVSFNNSNSWIHGCDTDNKKLKKNDPRGSECVRVTRQTRATQIAGFKAGFSKIDSGLNSESVTP